MRTRLLFPLLALAIGCTSESNPTGVPVPATGPAPSASETPKPAAGRTSVSADGSSTVFPLTSAVAEEFQKLHSDVRVTVGLSGTGGGFKRFCVGETDISNASRPIQEKEEATAKEHGIGFIELPVAFDGIAIVVNKNNSFVDHLTVGELKEIWGRDGKFRRWKDVRPNWPDRPIVLYGPGTDSGTFDYFVEAILGKGGACRPDFSASENDNFIVTGVAGDPDSLGYFGFAYYQENQERLRVIPIAAAGKAPVTPAVATINDGTYAPLSRPIFIYISEKSAAKPEVRSFVDFYLEHAAALSAEVGYVPLADTVYALAKDRFGAKTTGSVFRAAEAGSDLEAVMRGTAKKNP